MRVLGIDPGFTESAFVVIGPDGAPGDFGIEANDVLLQRLRRYEAEVNQPFHFVTPSAIVIEQVASFGMPVGAEVFETVFWTGRFAEAARTIPVHRITRLQVKMHLCHNSRAKDGNVRQALIDRFGGSTAKGTKKAPGPLYGISRDVWSALAVGLTFWDAQQPG